MLLLIRYFGAAQAAAGVEEEKVVLPDGSTLADVLDVLIREHPDPGAQTKGAPALESVIARSSFLRNEIACKDRSAVLEDQDIIDILPPFAGG
ncbi:Molybdopterin converting factor, small subunit [Arthrobacter sp. VKM Ac-2550]|nr:Molybdopterin converting factor, small subunit [Arthrobacter sp. VKM Ac-2550]